MKEDIKEILITEEELKEKVQELGKILTKDYKDKNPLVICVLRGAVMFLSDLLREIDTFVDMDFMAVSSYEGTNSSGVVNIVKDLTTNIEGRDVLIVEDILDTGRTLDYLMRILNQRHPKSMKICSLLIKKGREEIKVPVDYYGFYIPNEFVVGYGLDYDDKYRNLKYIGILKEEVYS
ncbi:hypoxanthine phosphoribosyltransferase [Anaerofustis stercorihominis]|uniref:Hypoxanthine phosphoribosyltransferase n=3 Tax=Anaerofustis stercorihominis TaxID=214853 RepID=B1C980_9FIRM|nr:hypoxanthine phosphoribosyltransferase [Anaerofustis stercorihominis]EDS72244.1 hypoxanthine phosphoribosyltransferase [Anaerofustis stercorihominis DSM 17244]MCQ4795156.1 hypoxanthine phosphoribosyltransferase [Anaerofustis stercorihominis]RGD73213.1 hypoxanthine phosphoribosyltransferase [Anaerofustis stercorihominis]